MRTHVMSEQAISVEELENYIAHLKEQKRLPEALDRLMKNEDFQKIVMNEYLREEAIRSTMLKADPSMADRQQQVENALIGVAQFNQFLQRIRTLGAMAERDLPEAEEALHNFYAEEQE